MPARSHSSSLLRRAALLATVSVALALAQAIISGRLFDLRVQLGELVLVVAIAGVPYVTTRHRRFPAKWLLPAYALAVGVATVARAGHLPPTFREALFFSNANVLGATLALAGVGTVMFFRSVWAGALEFLVLVAIALSGSRAAFWSFVIVLLILLIFVSAHSFTRWVLASLVTAVVVVVPVIGQSRPSRNLLRFSNDYSNPQWYTGYAKTFETRQLNDRGPLRGAKPVEIVGQTNASGRDGTLLVTQSVSGLRLGTPVVASIYVRSASPERIVLTTNLSRVTCAVQNVWSRCVTPPGYVVAYKSPQLQLRTTRLGGRLNLQVWGAQLEIGLVPSPPEVTDSSIAARARYYVLRRLDPASWFGRYANPERGALVRASVQLFLSHPWVGVGIGEFRKYYARTPEHALYSWPVHAHDLLLQLLSERGVLGTIGFLTVWAGAIGLLVLAGDKRAIYIALTLALLNATDYLVFTNGVFYPYWVTIGTLAGDIASRNHNPVQSAKRTTHGPWSQ